MKHQFKVIYHNLSPPAAPLAPLQQTDNNPIVSLILIEHTIRKRHSKSFSNVKPDRFKNNYSAAKLIDY